MVSLFVLKLACVIYTHSKLEKLRKENFICKFLLYNFVFDKYL